MNDLHSTIFSSNINLFLKISNAKALIIYGIFLNINVSWEIGLNEISEFMQGDAEIS